MRPNPDGDGKGRCIICGAKLSFDPPPRGEVIEAIACGADHAKEAGLYLPRAPKVMEAEVAEGAPVARVSEGFTHLDSGKSKPKRGNCPECGGEPYKRGWKHQGNCSLSSRFRAKKVGRKS